MGILKKTKYSEKFIGHSAWTWKEANSQRGHSIIPCLILCLSVLPDSFARKPRYPDSGEIAYVEDLRTSSTRYDSIREKYRIGARIALSRIVKSIIWGSDERIWPLSVMVLDAKSMDDDRRQWQQEYVIQPWQRTGGIEDQNCKVIDYRKGKSQFAFPVMDSDPQLFDR